MVKDQLITDTHAIYCTDCMYGIAQLPDASIDLSVYSPPFAGLYNYSSSPNDFSNCETPEQFLEQYEYLIAEMARVTKPGRINAVHITDVMGKDGDMWDLPHHVKRLHQKHGFAHRNTVTIWKNPLKVRMRTLVKSLTHKLIVEDSTECFTAMPDYLLIFKRNGQNAVPVEHRHGLYDYFGAWPLLPMHLGEYGLPIEQFAAEFGTLGDFEAAYEAYVWASFRAMQRKWEDHDDPRTNKLSHIIWQRYASSVWDDVRIDNVLKFKDARDEDDEKHVHPLQLDVIDRVVELYSNPGETVLTPFMGVGSEVYSPVSLGRKAIGYELKDSYFTQALRNMADVQGRYSKKLQLTLV